MAWRRGVLAKGHRPGLQIRMAQEPVHQLGRAPMQVQSSSHSEDSSHEWSTGNIKLGKAPFQNDPRSLLRHVAACSAPASTST
jgi:hypothetical protein